ncbi:MAG: 50S ribosomal protein L18 [Chitinophagales bacterium]|nr:50S ribosomal protein L18 [Chitinophagales bacterium]
MSNDKLLRRKRIKQRIRKIVNGTAERPRLNVFRSNKEIYAQLLNDDSKTTIASTSSLKLNKDGKTKTDLSKEVGLEIAKIAIEKGIDKIVFDRNGYLYHGRVKALAEGAREGGLKF